MPSGPSLSILQSSVLPLEVTTAPSRSGGQMLLGLLRPSAKIFFLDSLPGIIPHVVLMHSSRPVTEVEPQLTLRGHSAAITRLIIAPSKQLIYSASLDSTVRVWALPSSAHTTYAPFDASRLRGELIGHTDAVWDLALVRDECTLISGGAEGVVKVWDVSDASGRGSLRLSWTYNGVDFEGEEPDDLPGVTAVEAIKVDLKKVAVAYQNATIKIFDVVHGKELAVLHGESGSGKLCIPWIIPFSPSFQMAGSHKRTALFHIRQCPF